MFRRVIVSIIPFHSPGDKRRVESFAGAASLKDFAAIYTRTKIVPGARARVKAAPLQTLGADPTGSLSLNSFFYPFTLALTDPFRK